MTASPDRLRFSPSDPRVRALNEKPETKGDYVLYWSQIARRPSDNAALAYAIERANALGLPCLVYEALRPDYPFASDRFHTFVLEGARDMADGLAARGVAYAFFLPKTRDEARGVVAKMMARAALVVSDDFPTFVIAAHNAHSAARAACAYVVVDDCAGVPMALFPKEEYGARTIRPKIHKVKDAWLLPLHEPAPKVEPKARLSLPFDPLDVAALDDDALAKAVAGCAVDHTVPAVRALRGGAIAAKKRLDAFLAHKLAAYDVDRNEPGRDATSHLSPYLHFGMVSARNVALAARAWAEERNAAAAAEPFLEQLLVRRGLAYNFALRNPRHTTYDAIPAWAKATLEEHRRDQRELTLTVEQLTDARSPDEVWNAAQLELRTRGVVHNYMRMLWGKLALTWMNEPREVFDALIHINDRFAMDGRDPNTYASIAWCFGVHDRPWPERAIFGKVRCMTSRSARSKLDLDGYLAEARSWRQEL